MRKPVASMSLTHAPATKPRGASAKPRRRFARARLIQTLAAAKSFTFRRQWLSYQIQTLTPFCPPGFLLERSRRLTRAGFFTPSRDGDFRLFEPFNPSRRSSSAILAVGAAIPAAWAAIGAISSSLDGSPGESRIIRLLHRKPTLPARKICPAKPDRDRQTWVVTQLL
jgi:hypothetical protein